MKSFTFEGNISFKFMLYRILCLIFIILLLHKIRILYLTVVRSNYSISRVGEGQCELSYLLGTSATNLILFWIYPILTCRLFSCCSNIPFSGWFQLKVCFTFWPLAQSCFEYILCKPVDNSVVNFMLKTN